MPGISDSDNYRDNFIDMLVEVQDTFYNLEETSLLRDFIEGYSHEIDFYKICFSCSNGSGTEIMDRNRKFRDKVSVFICLNTSIKVPPLILKDLIQEIGKESRNSWGGPEYLFLLSEQFLKRTTGEYIETFGEMLFSNMDTYADCTNMDFSEIDVKTILDELNGKAQQTKLVIDLIEYFESHI